MSPCYAYGVYVLFYCISATVSLISSVYCFGRSLIAVTFLYGVCYVTLIEIGKVGFVFHINPSPAD